MTASPHKASLKQSFRHSLLTISAVIVCVEALIMFMFGVLPQLGIVLTPLQEGFADTVILSSLVAPMIWLLSLRPLAVTIAQQQTSNAAQAHENQQLRNALDASSEMIIVADALGGIQHANPAVCVFTGWKKEELVGRSPAVLDSSNANPQTLAEMHRSLKQHDVWQGRLLNRRKGAAPFNIAGQTTPPDTRDYWGDTSITAIRGSDGALIGYVQTQRDITEQVNQEKIQSQKNAETVTRLAISEILQKTLPLKQRFTQVIENIFSLDDFDLQRKGGIFLKASDEDYLDMYVLNGSFSEEFIRREQRIPLGACLCGRAAISQELIVSDDCFCDPRHEHQFADMQAHGHYIVPIVSAGITLGILFLYTDAYPIRTESRLTTLQQIGDMLALALLQEQANQSLAAARDVAEQAAKSKTEFLANMSHEIRTPMNGVLGMLDILKDTEMTIEQIDVLDTVANSAESLLTIINDILDFSKLEAGKVELEHIEFNLSVLVEEVCTLMASRAHAKNLELACFLPPCLPQCWYGDPTRIRQVLTNLIGNAIKFTEQGEVSIKVLTQTSAEDKITLRFEVQDTGIGMSPESQSRLFQPFAQADSSTSRRFGGTGLGLSISKNLVDVMQGAIGLESALGQGTCFWFSLPLQSSNNSAPARLTDLSGKCALIVDDNATNRKILNHYLQHWGVIVSEFDNAPAALIELDAAVKRGEPYDILLSDLHMPDMDGLELARAINTNPSIAATPRLLLSSGGMDTKAERLEVGYVHSLLKPVRQTQLFDIIASTLRTAANKIVLPAKAIAEELPNYKHKRILVAEDQVVNQKVIVAMLGKFQCLPDIAENGKEALDKLAQQRYDLVLMDCQMPVMDGYEAVRTWRGEELTHNNARTPIVALTAHAATGAREECLAAGMDDFLSKPITRPDLAKMLAHWLDSTDSGKTVLNVKEDYAKYTPFSDYWDKAATLDRLDGDQELLNKMMDLFISETPNRLKELDAALADLNPKAMAEIAHGLKGMGGLFCAQQLFNASTNLEHSARHGQPADFHLLCKQVSSAATALITAFVKNNS